MNIQNNHVISVDSFEKLNANKLVKRIIYFRFVQRMLKKQTLLPHIKD